MTQILPITSCSRVILRISVEIGDSAGSTAAVAAVAPNSLGGVDPISERRWPRVGTGRGKGCPEPGAPQASPARAPPSRRVPPPRQAPIASRAGNMRPLPSLPPSPRASVSASSAPTNAAAQSRPAVIRACWARSPATTCAPSPT
eukprot:5573012-Pleurochrysis_carterae.AAC.1